MAWLVHGDRLLASAEIARTRRARARGLLGRDPGDTVLVLPRTSSIHTVGMTVPIDVARCDGDHRVVDVRTIPPCRVLGPRRRVRTVIEAPVGAFRRWGVVVGDRLEVRHG